MQESAKPWGWEHIWADTESYVAKVLEVQPNQRLSLHYHNEKAKTLMVMGGEGIIVIGDAEFIVTRGSVFHIDPKTVHRVGAGDKGLLVIEVSTPHLDDVVRLHDDYARPTSVDELTEKLINSTDLKDN